MKRIILLLIVVFLPPAICTASQVTDRCAATWGNDYKMREYCINRQNEASTWVNQWYYHGRVDQEIYELCAGRWSDNFGQDWPMLKHCIEQQQAARDRLGRY